MLGGYEATAAIVRKGFFFLTVLLVNTRNSSFFTKSNARNNVNAINNKKLAVFDSRRNKVTN